MAMSQAELTILVKMRNEAAKELAALDSALGKTGKSAGGLGGAFNTMKGAALPIVGVLAGAAAGAVALGINFANAASNLGEAQNKANLTFKEAVGDIEKFASTSAESYGISERAALEYTSTLGTILNATGLSRDASAEMSQQLTVLAADLASVNNIPIADALEKLRAGLVGEAEPLRTVGVLLSEAAVKAKAAEMGLGDMNGVLTEGEKVQARYAIIMEQTADAHGDAANTIGSLAGQQKVFGAVMEDVKASLGQAFLPILTSVMQAMNGFLIENKEEIRAFGEAASLWLQENLPRALEFLRRTWEDLKPSVTAFVAMLRDDVLPVVREVIAFIEEHWPEIRAVIEYELREIENKIKTALGIIEGVFHVFHGILTGDFREVWEGIKQIVSSIMDGIKEAVRNRLDLIKALFGGAFTEIKNGVTAKIGEVLSFLQSVPGSIQSALGNMAALLYQKGVDLIFGLLSGAQAKANELLNWLRGLPGQIIGGLSGLASLLYNVATEAMNFMIAGFQAIIPNLIAVAGNIKDQIKEKLDPRNWFSTPEEHYRELWGAAFRSIGDEARSALPGIGSAAASVIQTITDSLESGQQDISNFFDSVLGQARDMVGGLRGELGRLSGMDSRESLTEHAELLRQQIKLIDAQARAEQERAKINEEVRLLEHRASEERNRGNEEAAIALEHQAKNLKDSKTAAEQEVDAIKATIDELGELNELRRLERDLLQTEALLKDQTLASDQDINTALTDMNGIMGSLTGELGHLNDLWTSSIPAVDEYIDRLQALEDMINGVAALAAANGGSVPRPESPPPIETIAAPWHANASASQIALLWESYRRQFYRQGMNLLELRNAFLANPASAPGFATGGFVPGPPGQPMMAVVHGGEQVLTPQQQQQRGGGGGNVYVQGPVYITGDPAASLQSLGMSI